MYEKRKDTKIITLKKTHHIGTTVAWTKSTGFPINKHTVYCSSKDKTRYGLLQCPTKFHQKNVKVLLPKLCKF